MDYLGVPNKESLKMEEGDESQRHITTEEVRGLEYSKGSTYCC